MIKNVVFDWSGVINDNVDDVLRAINGMYGELGEVQITKSELRDRWIQPYMKFHRLYYPKLTLAKQKKLYSKYILIQNTNKCLTGITKLIRNLKRNRMRLFILSGDQPHTLFKELKGYKLENYFEKIYCDFHDKETVVKELIKKNHLVSEETVFIGDSNHEIEIGKKVGAITIAVSWGFSSIERLRKSEPDFIVQDCKELTNVILNTTQI